MNQSSASRSVKGFLGRYRLHPAVFYRAAGDETVVYHTERRMVFDFNGIVADILDCFVAPSGIEEVLERLRDAYDIPDEEDFIQSVGAFIEELASKGILLAEETAAGSATAIEREISSRFAGCGRLASATLELTYRCNERCRHCYIAREDRVEMGTDEFKEAIDELAEMGVIDLAFTGGELFMRKDAFEILEHAYKRRFVVDVFTNGTLLDAEACIRLKALWPRCVHFSVYSHVPARHDAVTRVPGSHQKTLAAIRRCVAVGLPVNIKAPLFEETKDDVAGLTELAHSLGASIELGGNITPRKDGDMAPLAMEIRGEAERARVADEIRAATGGRLAGVQVDVPDAGTLRSKKICSAGESSISINPYGDVFPCPVLPLRIGNVMEQPIREIWEKSPELLRWHENNVRDRRRGCDGCRLAQACMFCPGEAMLRTGNPLSRYDKACQATCHAAGMRRKGGEAA